MTPAWAARVDAGFTVVEIMASMTVTVVVCGAVLAAVDTAQRVATATEEVADLQQRLRVALESIAGELAGAGAGPERTAMAGPLLHAFPPVVPIRRGQTGDDARAGVAFRPDVLSLAYVASTVAQATVERTLDLGGGRLRVSARPNCGPLAPVAVCGFTAGMRVLLFEASGAHDFLTVEAAAGPELDLSYRGPLSAVYGAGAVMAHLEAHTFARRDDPLTGLPQLTHYDGFLTERPIVDHVVGLTFEYFGDADPPRLRAGAEPGVAPGPWTTYGPAPPPLGVDDAATAWGPGENCAFTVADGRHAPRLAVLGPAGGLVPLTPALLSDGPWCPDAAAPRRYDADLFRVRQIRVRVRAEVASRAMRGAAGAMFRRAGTPSALAPAPDQEAVLDIVPRNLATRR